MEKKNQMDIDAKKQRAKALVLKMLYETETDAEDNHILSELEKLVPYPDVTKYLFWSEEFYDEDEHLDIDSLLEKAFNYQPNVIVL